MKRSAPWAWPLVVGALALSLTAWVWQHERQTQDQQRRRAFDLGVRQVTARIEQRFGSYELMLRSVRGLLETVGTIDERHFAEFVDGLLAGADAAGLRSLGQARLVDADPVRAPIVLVAPATDTTLAALGTDMLSDPARAAAMSQATESGGVALTRHLRAAAAGQPAAETELVLYLPLYAKGPVLDTLAARRGAVRGWVYAVFGIDDLMASLYGEGTPGLALRIDEGSTPSPEALMFTSDAPGTPAPPARYQAQEYLGLAGRTWTISVRSTSGFEGPAGTGDPARLIAITGTGLSLLAAALTWLLVTGRDRADEAARTMTRRLREGAERYRRIVETADEGIWLVDTAGRTTFANPKLLQLLGQPAAGLQGRHWSEWVEPDPAAPPGTAPAALPPPGELRLRRQDGSTLWVQLHTSPLLDEQGGPAGALAMVTDVSGRHQAEARRALLEAQLRQSQKMEAIGTLAGGIAHDFNNILGAVLGHLALLRHDLAGDTVAQARVAQIGEAAQRARSLVQQIVAFSRQQPQQLVVQPLQPLLHDAVRLLRPTLPARVELRLEVDERPLPVAADATQLQQVLMNLCTNAWHAFGEDGRGQITIGARAALVGAAQAARLGLPPPGAATGGARPCVRLWVQDDGCGMDDATRARVFEPFFTTKPVGQGTGLGLAVVHGIVTAHGGAITVDSTPGAGTRFDLWLALASLPAEAVAIDPAQRQADAGAASPLPPPSGASDVPRPPRRAQVLYVDDDPVMAVVAEALLLRGGWRATSLSDPQRALALATASDSDVVAVVTDYNMPAMSGLDLARRLRAARPGLPVLVSSGFVTDALRAEAAAAGVAQVMQKEFTAEQLVPLLGALLNPAAPGRAPMDNPADPRG